ncbi:MAG: BrnA antitoxin family protein, partial [Planctomycetes bacterium]|nr:BrnA antitoxin family protein [Planctomycetota bacterium]
DFWRRAALRMPRKKESVTLQLDHDVLSWFRGLGRGYQTRINAVLRSYVKAATKAQS